MVTIEGGAPEAAQWTISGQVHNPYGPLRSGTKVEAVLKKRWSEVSLGLIEVDATGAYRLSYTPPAGMANGRTMIRVFNGNGNIALATATAPSAATGNDQIDVVIRDDVDSETVRLDYGAIARTPNQLAAAGVDISGLEQKAERHAKRSAFSAFRRYASREFAAFLDRVEPELRVMGSKSVKLAILQAVEDYEPSEGEGTLRSSRDAVLSEASRLAARMTSTKAADDLLQPERPLNQNEFFSPEVQLAQLEQIGAIVGLNEATLSIVTERMPLLSAVQDKTLTEMVDKGELTAAEAAALGLTLSLYRLVDENDTLTAAIRVATGLQSIRDLAALSRQQWQTMLLESQAALPEGQTVESYAAVLQKRIEHIYPTASLFGRLAAVDSASLTADLTTLDSVLKTTGPLFTSRGSAVPPGLTEDQQSALQRIQKLTRRYPGLGFDSLANDTSLTPEQKTSRIIRGLGLLSRLEKANSTLEFVRLDYTPGSPDADWIDFTWLSELATGETELAALKKQVLEPIKAYRRIYALSQDVDNAVAMAESGYTSSLRLASTRVDQVVADTGLDMETIIGYRKKAQRNVTAVAGCVSNLRELTSGIYLDLPFFNLPTSADDYLVQIAGYEELFGSQDYCRCDPCSSVLSPGAYFVDLMYFVEQNILNTTFSGKEDHPLHLKVRRPDLWTLELTCENTGTVIPYLTVVNDILENFVSVNEATDAWTVLADATGSFRQPFTLPLEQLALYLSHFDKTRAELAELAGIEGDDLAAATLGISSTVYKIITTANTDLTELKDLYRRSFTETDGMIEAFDAQELLEPMGISRDDLGALVATSYVTGGTPDSVTIVGEKQSAESIQNDVENIHGLTAAALDRMHRFMRLQKALSWTIPELDLVLVHLGSGAVTTEIDAPALRNVGTILDLKQRLGLSIELLTPLWSDLPTTKVSDNDALLDRLFNLDEFIELDSTTYPSDVTRFIHPAFVPADAVATVDSGNILSRLIAGLQISDEDLYGHIVHLSGPLAIDAANSFALSTANLSLLYRHARLAALFGVSADELYQLIGLAGSIPGGYAGTLADLDALVSFFDWWKSTDYSLDDLGFVTGGTVLDPTAYASAEDLASQLITKVASEGALNFADTIFAFVANITEDDSRQIIASNVSAIEVAPDTGTYRLVAGYNLTPLTVPPGIETEKGELVAQLQRYHASEIIPSYLAGLLGTDADRTKQLITMAGVNLLDARYAKALQGDPAFSGQLTGLISLVLPLQILFAGDVFTPDVLDGIRTDSRYFGITTFTKVGISSVQAIVIFRTFLDTAAAGEFSTQDLFSALPTLSAGGDAAALAKVLQADESLVTTLLKSVAIPRHAVAALDKLSQCVEAAQYLGVSGDTLRLAASNDIGELTAATTSILAAFRAKYDEDEYEEKIAAFDDKLNELKRDALTDYILSRSGENGYPPVEDLQDLYYYFLLDVQTSGCTTTSRVVAAMSSVQLYVQRCMMGLEQSADGKVNAQLDDEAKDEWEWRKNYRVWEANRKVFLSPEDYLYESLRDDKTPLFKALEDTLLQQDINADTVLDAYAAYMRGFEEVANLKIAGSYHDIGADSDVLHLFGVTPSEPATYYYRTVENAYHSGVDDGVGIVWNPWQMMDVKIPVRRVSPIVFQDRLYVFWVEIATRADNKISDGTTEFVGYQHTMMVKFTTLRLDGTWTAPQQLRLYGVGPFTEGEGVVTDPLVTGYGGALPTYGTPPEDLTDEVKALDGYTLKGVGWEQVYPENVSVITAARAPVTHLCLSGRNWGLQRAPVDFYTLAFSTSVPSMPVLANAKVVASKVADSGGTKTLYTGSGKGTYVYCTIYLEQSSIYWGGLALGSISVDELYTTPLADLDQSVELAVVNGSLKDAIIDASGDLFLLQGSVDDEKYLLQRLGTTLSETLSKVLFTKGVESLLDLEDTQLKLAEAPLPFEVFDSVEKAVKDLDFTGPYGVYLREIFFHIPLLLGENLNSNQSFEEARKWLEYIFNPTATGTGADRFWRYREFHEYTIPTLREQLTDQTAIEEYRKNPFSPHAIARLRLVAYEKAVVMKYVKNLIDWGDSLFLSDTTESINEATLLYVMAADILGNRPAELGDCGEAELEPKTYANISPYLSAESEFLIEMEQFTFGGAAEYLKATVDYTYVLSPTLITATLGNGTGSTSMIPTALLPADARAVNRAASAAVSGAASGNEAIFQSQPWNRTSIVGWSSSDGKLESVTGHSWKDTVAPNVLASMGLGLMRQTVGTTTSPVFCVPNSENLLAYWDLVADRLYKIRNCMNISGVQRTLSLLASPIDPMLLVRATAQGLSLEDALNSISGDLPPYRFTYLIEKAKAYAQSLQSFGSALLSALERKDNAELERLRAVHEQNILSLTTEMKEQDISAADEAINELAERYAAVDARKTYFVNLLATGLLPSETLQQVSQMTAASARDQQAMANEDAALYRLAPQIGAPTAITFGGIQISGYHEMVAAGHGVTASLAEGSASATGVVASFQRREQEWTFQKDQADKELAQIVKQQAAAEIRKAIAEQALEVHSKSLEQANEIYEYFGSKFTGLGLYTLLSTTLHSLYREAYNGAYEMARLAEQAYNFERSDYSVTVGSHWDAANAGLLAGELLLVDLQNMERRFIELNYRKLEVTQTFSLLQIDPAALIALRESGECSWTIPEFFFDLAYPGHYNRRIRAVRLTIPCVSGPYTNVSATLDLQQSWLRPSSTGSLSEVPRTRSISVATSTGQNDGGVFELNFHDERYMPFEYLGAVSGWQLSLPKSFRTFDYDTISDVLLHISYEADADGVLKQKVEEGLQADEGSILNYLTTTGMARVFSLRREFPSQFHKLLYSAVGTDVLFDLTEKHYPLFLSGLLSGITPLKVSEAVLAIDLEDGQSNEGFALTVDDGAVVWTSQDGLGGLLGGGLAAFGENLVGQHKITITAAGALAKNGNSSAIDSTKVSDMYLYLQYKLPQ